MKVSELIAELSELPQDLEVKIGWGAEDIARVTYYDKPYTWMGTLVDPYVCIFE